MLAQLPMARAPSQQALVDTIGSLFQLAPLEGPQVSPYHSR